MISVKLYLRKDKLCGFEIKGHSTVDSEDFDGKLVCSAVSGAAIMTANTITEIIGDRAAVEAYDGYLRVVCNDEELCKDMLYGFKLHISALCDEYPERIRITIKAE